MLGPQVSRREVHSCSAIDRRSSASSLLTFKPVFLASTLSASDDHFRGCVCLGAAARASRANWRMRTLRLNFSSELSRRTVGSSPAISAASATRGSDRRLQMVAARFPESRPQRRSARRGNLPAPAPHRPDRRRLRHRGGCRESRRDRRPPRAAAEPASRYRCATCFSSGQVGGSVGLERQELGEQFLSENRPRANIRASSRRTCISPPGRVRRPTRRRSPGGSRRSASPYLPFRTISRASIKLGSPSLGERSSISASRRCASSNLSLETSAAAKRRPYAWLVGSSA